ncbi:MRN complex-interacting protein isoform X2 [Sciurus carolinensis]|uniref:MRN complex-interacting protein isoform X2 n=1 Tax=Sciurus carolinensis TaxID=30640 RepID=UPI001FB55C37|nr:MRN complex-interacting protein isoform X2 [Sciurus carolinensis]
MAPSQQSRVLRCCSCRLFQAHQVKKSLKWTCKACGEKQSFMRAYGEGSGADCRRHVQKLNLLQGQVSELSLRSLGTAVNAGKENAGGQQAENGTPQGKSQALETRWLKYLDKGSPEKELEGGICFHTQPSSNPEQPGPPANQALPRKRKWSQSTDQPPQTLVVQDSDDTEVTLEPQEGYTDLTRTMQQGSSHDLQNSVHCHTRELSFPRWKLPNPAPQLKAPSSKWARFLLSPGNNSHVDTEVPRPLQRGSGPTSPAQAEQGTPRTETPREGHPSKPTTTSQCPQATHMPMSRPERPCGKTPEQSWGTGPPLVQGVERAPPVQLCHLFSTGEDFDDDL